MFHYEHHGRSISMKTLIIFSHSYYQQSRINRSMLEIANLQPDVTIRNLDGLYGTDFNEIDVAEEQKLLIEHARIIFQCPVFWFNVPPMLKAYMDRVFTHGWAYGGNGHALAGKLFQLVVSAGSSQDKYRKGGLMLEELFKPVLTSAAFVGMAVLQPMITYGCMGMTEDELRNVCQNYKKLLQSS